MINRILWKFSRQYRRRLIMGRLTDPFINVPQSTIARETSVSLAGDHLYDISTYSQFGPQKTISKTSNETR